MYYNQSVFGITNWLNVSQLLTSILEIPKIPNIRETIIVLLFIYMYFSFNPHHNLM